MERKSIVLKFCMLSIIAIIFFFVPIGNANCAVVILCGLLKSLLSPYGKIIVLVFVSLGLLSNMKKRDKKWILMCVISLIIIILSFIDTGLLNEAVELAFSICITVFISGTLSVLITDSGLVEFVAVFFENIMRKMLKVPGNATMDIITSFFSSSSVGVFITSQYYKEKIYTKREASFIASNFSVVSFGFMFGIISITQLNSVSLYVILLIVLLNFVLGMIMRRISPIIKIPDTLCDGSIRQMTNENRMKSKLQKGVEKGMNKAKNFTIQTVFSTAKRTLIFCIEIMIQVIPIYFVSLVVMNYTNIFELIGKPFEIILSMLHVPSATIIAPTIIIGIFEVSLPAMFISGFSLPLSARFFVTVLSLVQIIFFTETANAILQSDIPLKVRDLIKIFFLRTLFAIPILAIIVNILF